MDRNNVTGFVLLGILLIAFFIFQSRFSAQQREELVQKQHIEDSIRQANQPEFDSAALIRPKQTSTITLPDSVLQNFSQDEIKQLEDSIHRAKTKSIYGPFADYMNKNEQTYVLENEHLKIELTNKGGRIKTAELKEFKDYNGGSLNLISGDSNSFNYSFYYNTDKLINTEDLYFDIIPSPNKKSVTFRVNAGDGKFLEQVYSFNDTTYLIDYDFKLTGFNGLIPAQIPIITLSWQNDMQEQEKDVEYERQYSKLYFSYANGDVDYKNTNGKIDFDSRVKWISCQQQFFNTSLIAKNSFDNTGHISVFSDEDSTRFVKRCNAELYIAYNNQTAFEFPMQWYLAPNHYQSLKELDLGMETIVPTGSGIIAPINKWAIIPLFNWLGGFISNYGLIILLLTVIIKLVLSPLTYRSYLSMAKMRVLQPEMTQLREKYKDEPGKYGQEQLKLFRKAGVSPLGGCIPTLLSMPILIAMFRFFPGSIELRQEPFLWADDLSTYDDILRWNFEIPFLGSHLSIFCVLMTISSLMYIRMNMQNTTQITGPMKTMQYIVPVFFMFFLNSSPAGLTYYYFVSNVVTFGQQWGIRRFLINDEEIHRKIQEHKTKPQTKSKFQQRLEDAMKQQQKLKDSRTKQAKKR
jgi:YidC/Oxa1 family membrane protein insertase